MNILETRKMIKSYELKYAKFNLSDVSENGTLRVSEKPLPKQQCKHWQKLSNPTISELSKSAKVL